MIRGGRASSFAGEASPTPQRFRRLSLMPPRHDIWATPGRGGAAAARVLYQPRHRVRIAALGVAQHLPATSHRSFPSPHLNALVESIAADAGIAATAAAALHVRGTDRWLYALMSGDGNGVVMKVGSATDEGLVREATTLAALRDRQMTLNVPVLRWHGQHDEWFALVTDIVKRNGTEDPDLEDACAAACALATINGDFVVHGDLAPWNMIRSTTGIALVDWEKSRFADDPLWDLTHYVVRVGALLQKWQPRAAVAHLVGSESVGRRYLREIGLDPASAAEHVRRYIRRPTKRTAENSNIRRYELEMAEILSSNPA